jgi:hypothetical protein
MTGVPCTSGFATVPVTGGAREALNSLIRSVRTYAQTVGQVALGRKTAGRGLTVLPDDVFLVSYLRSGSTWARFLFGNLTQEEAITFANVNRLVPLIYDFPDRILRGLPRLLKSHECFDPRYPRVIHIVRDPRDVAVSFYYYNIKVGVLPDDYSIDEFVDRFLTARIVGYADRLGSWEDHTLSWLRLREGRPGYRRVRYEDLLSDAAGELTRLAPFLKINPDPETIGRAVTLSSAGHMRSLEQKQWKGWETTKNTRSDIPFVREAKSGSWQGKLSLAAAQKIETAWGSTMEELGYQLSTVPNSYGNQTPLIAPQ